MDKLGDSSHRLISFVVPGRYKKSFDLCRSEIIVGNIQRTEAMAWGDDWTTYKPDKDNFLTYGHLPFINPYTYTKASSFSGTAFLKKTDGTTLSYPADDGAEKTCNNCENFTPSSDSDTSYSGVFDIRAYGKSCYSSESTIYCQFVGMDYGSPFYGSQVMWAVNSKEYYHDSSNSREEGFMTEPTSGSKKFRMTSEKEGILLSGNALSSHSLSAPSRAPVV